MLGYFGAPPGCRPECVINSECAPSLACINLKCANPCVGVCGINAKCDVVNHNPICSCPVGYIGDPFTSCRQKPPGKYLLPFLINIHDYMNLYILTENVKLLFLTLKLISQ